MKALFGLPAPLAIQFRAYLRANRACVRYDQFRQRGLRSDSGPVEVAHRTLPQARVKCSGAGPMTGSIAYVQP